MLKFFSPYLKLAAAAGLTYLATAAYSYYDGNKSLLLEYIKKNFQDTRPETEKDPISPDKVQVKAAGSRSRPGLFLSTGKLFIVPEYTRGDWDRYVISPQYTSVQDKGGLLKIYESEDIQVQSYGSMIFNVKYGHSSFTDKKYKQFDEDKPVSRVVKDGLAPEQITLLHIEGTVGQRMTLFIDHDSRRQDNIYQMQYKAINDDEVIREINAGQIDIKFDHSKYAVYDSNSQKGMGLDLTIKKDKFKIKAFGSVIRGETEVELFKGNSSAGSFKISEFQYIKRNYYQIEPFRRYDNSSSVPTGSSGYTTLTALSSYPSSPENYRLYPVDIDPNGFDLYMDDQNAHNNFNAITLPIDKGLYVKLVQGKDYSINFSTGVVTFISIVPESARIFAAYNLKSGATSDPGVISPGDTAHPGGAFSGKLIVFIKYGYSMDEDINKDLALGASEDRNNDGKLNLDIYEMRSIYSIGERQLLQNNFQIHFFRENQELSKSDIQSIGKYAIDYENGLVKFTLREPFKSLLKTNYSSAVSANVYAEKQTAGVFTDSHYSILADYFRDARSFKLKHFNIIPNSVKVKVNKRDISENLFTVDLTSGLLVFNDSGNPLIGPETEIEIKYEYLPLGTTGQSFIGGLRGDYEINRSLNIGGTLMYSRDAPVKIIPNIGDTPTQTLIYEGDMSLHLDGKRLAGFTNNFTDAKRSSLPVQIHAYGEYARSIKKVNTFGKGLIDNMESTDEIIHISLSEKDWILSSMPPLYTQADRGLLYYYFYRSLSSPETLKGLSHNAAKIDYAVKPGPFNVATGHVDSSFEKETSQRSLALDFDFSTGSSISIATRKLSDGAVDFSGLHYIEIWYKYEGTSAVNMSIDVGRINEDSDGDGIIDTEDINNNGFIDSNPNAGYSEDTGYSFNGNIPTRVGSGPRLNSMTKGDGILNTEDINGNGILDTVESSYSFGSISLTSDPASWKVKRIYIDQSALAQSDIAILKQVEAVRISIQNSVSAKGRIYIDTIKFVSMRYRNVEMNGSPAGPASLSMTIVSSLNDSEYRAESFLLQNKELYNSLYGDKTDKELSKTNESALQLDYSITAGNYVSVTRKFLKPMDLRFYKTLNVWFNYRKISGSEKIGIVLGSSENDYITYTVPADYLKVWREIKLKLKPNSHGDYDMSSVTGEPDLKRINFIKLIISGNTGSNGKIWINEMYVTEPEDLVSKAHWIEGEIKITKPLYTTASGTPIMSDINLKYIRKGHGAQFSTVGKTFSDVSENYREFLSSMKILPNWDTQMDFIREESSTDSLNENIQVEKRGKTVKDTYQFITDFMSLNNGVPSIKIAYKHDNYSNKSDQYISGNGIFKETEKSTHTPVITVKDELNNFLSGKLLTNVYIDMSFKNEKINRDSGDIAKSSLSTLTPASEQEKRQKSDALFSMNYTNKIFFIKPEIGMGSEEIVKLAGKTGMNDAEILTNVNGDFHFPFIYNDSFRFTGRNRKSLISAGLVDSYIVAPKYKLELSYIENRFKDYDEIEKSAADIFKRSRDARSFILSEINIPVSLSSSRELNLFKNLNITYMRSLYFLETDIPFEGEHSDSFGEEYGIKHSLFRYMDVGMNYNRYYPGVFFLGRHNYGNGRDYAFRNGNARITFPSGDNVPDYNNQLRLIDTLTTAWNHDFKIFSVDTAFSINQVAERMNINGIPQQVVTRSINTKFNFDLMKFFNTGFFRANRFDIPHHSANFTIGYNFANNLLITSNIQENVHSPYTGITLKWDRSHVSFNAGLDYRMKMDREFISTADSTRSKEDDIYIRNMPEKASFKEQDFGYKFSVLYETDVAWMYNLFSNIYKLTAFPIFSIEYSMLLNRYDYSKTVTPEPYDQFLIRNKLMLDLHKYIQGGIFTTWVLERFRNRETSAISKEIISYEVGFNFSLIF